MRLSGKLTLSLPERMEKVLQKNTSLFMDIPFTGLPIYPIGSSLRISVPGRNGETVVFGPLQIEHYHGMSNKGTEVTVSFDDLPELLVAFAELCTFVDNNGKSGDYTYEGVVDFNQC